MCFEQYKAVIEDCFPQISIHSVKPVLEGWDSLVLEVNGTLVFRFPRRRDVVAQLEKEILLLPELAPALSVAIPRFVFIGNANEALGGIPFVGYRRIEGVPLTGSQELAQQERVARQLSRVLSELHGFPVARAVQLGIADSTPAQWREECEGFYARVRGRVLPLLGASVRAQAAALWEGFLGNDANFHFSPALVHGDLGCEHILCDPVRGVVNGIIDWGDAAIGDPARDFAGLLYDCGRTFARRALEGYRGRVDEAFWDRVVFYARVVPFHVIMYGLEVGDEEHVRHGVTRLGREAPP